MATNEPKLTSQHVHLGKLLISNASIIKVVSVCSTGGVGREIISPQHTGARRTQPLHVSDRELCCAPTSVALACLPEGCQRLPVMCWEVGRQLGLGLSQCGQGTRVLGSDQKTNAIHANASEHLTLFSLLSRTLNLHPWRTCVCHYCSA